VLSSVDEGGEIFVTERKGHARELTLAAIARGCRLVVAWGGDGTVNEIGSALIGTSASLGIIPAGSGNGLARDLAIPRQPDRALTGALRATPRPIDAGRFGGRVFFNLAGVGFDARVAASFDRGQGGRGFSGYMKIAAAELFRYRPERYRIGGGARVRTPTALLITVANGSQFGNGMQIAPGARLDDGRLDLVVFEETSRLRTIGALPRLFAGRAAGARGFSIERIEQATIDCDRPMLFHVDGEPIEGGTRLEAQVLPAALRVCVG